MSKIQFNIVVLSSPELKSKFRMLKKRYTWIFSNRGICMIFFYFTVLVFFSMIVKFLGHMLDFKKIKNFKINELKN